MTCTDALPPQMVLALAQEDDIGQVAFHSMGDGTQAGTTTLISG